ncbi:MAG: M3 family oligoendopeptidase [Clostridiaceae bacterium]|nr:M3 family oligoendopeptidase [Clostridiaceae bacterium]
MEMPLYSEIIYERPSVDEFRELAMRTRLRLMTSKDITLIESSLAEFQKQLSHFYTAQSICHLRHDQNTNDAFFSDELSFFEENEPIVKDLTAAVYSVLISSEIAPMLMNRFGKMIFLKAKYQKESVSPEVITELSEEAALENRYEQILADAQIDFSGKKYNLSMMKPFLESSYRDERKRAAQAVSDFFSSILPETDKIFDDLVRLRTSIARKLSYSSFVELGYKRMERFDYTEADVEEFRRSILRYIVPLTVEIRRLQTKRLEVDELKYFDLPVLFPRGNPRPAVDINEYPVCTGEMFRALFEKDPSFFDVLREHGYTDIVSRKMKAAGAYCMTLLDYGIPFVFMNASGTSEDVSTIIHESGHAYASIRSVDSSPFIECLFPTLEVCEIHSTALEFLSYPYIELFFKANAEAYRDQHMTEALLFLPYGCMVDEFQHRIYHEPDMTYTQRHSVWKALEGKYQPFIDYDGNEFFESGSAWIRQSHIFSDPFYYIDYCLAQIVSLQLWDYSRTKPADALVKYDHICREGGNKTFFEILRSAGLESPFSPDVIKRIAYVTAEYLRL